MNPIMRKPKETKTEGITFLLNFFFSGAGHIYVGGKYMNTGIVYLVINCFMVVLTAVTGFFAILWIPFWIFVMVNGFTITKEYNADIEKENENFYKQEDEKKEQEKSHAENEKKKVKCSDFIENMEKTYKLYKNELLSEEEFISRKEKLITQINLNKIAEQPEDFLTSIISLKEKNILTQEELQKVKKYIL